MTLEEIQMVTIDEDIGVMSNYVLHGWPSTEAEVQKVVQPYWSLRDEMAVIE